jgi:hypothetical protein
MMMGKEQYDLLNKMVNDYCIDEEDDDSDEEERMVTETVRSVMKGLIKLIKKSDDCDLHTLTVFLLLALTIIHKGYDDVAYVCDLIDKEYISDIINNNVPEGCLNLKNPDGSYVTLKELGIE